MDPLLLSLLAGELRVQWAGAFVQQAWQDLAGRVVLRLRRAGPEAASSFLLLSPLPEAQGLGLVAERPAVPPRPPALAAYLRAHLVGGRLESCTCVPPERVVELVFRGRQGPLRLMLEATGRRGNLAVVDTGGRVRAAWRWEPADTHPLRPLVPGGPYAPPPRRSAPAEAEAPGETGVADSRASLPVAGRALVQAAGRQSACVAAAEAEARARRERRRLEGRAEKIRGDLSRLPSSSDLRRRADALAAGLSGVCKGDSAARVADPFGGGEVLTIELDVTRSPGENLNRLYERARKAERGRQVLEERLRVTLEEIEGGGELQALEPARHDASARSDVGPYRRFRAFNGWPIWAGRNGRENDRLVREARAWDLWFHARESPGAHVLLRLPGKEARVPEAAVAEAAGVAAFYSRRCAESLVDVMVVEAGRLRKPKGASPGQVLVSGERTVRVRPRVCDPASRPGLVQPARGRKG